MNTLDAESHQSKMQPGPGRYFMAHKASRKQNRSRRLVLLRLQDHKQRDHDVNSQAERQIISACCLVRLCGKKSNKSLPEFGGHATMFVFFFPP